MRDEKEFLLAAARFPRRRQHVACFRALSCEQRFRLVSHRAESDWNLCLAENSKQIDEVPPRPLPSGKSRKGISVS